MCARNVFEYATIRVVPYIERGEFLIAGVLMLCRTQRFLDAHIALDIQRLRSLAAGIDIPAIEEQLSYIPLVCHGGSAAGPIGELPLYERFRWLTAPRNTVIQPSPVHVGFCDDPQQMLEHLMSRYMGYSS